LSKTDEYKEILTESILKQISDSADSIIVSLYQTDLDLLFDPSVLSLFVYHSALQNIQQGVQLFGTCVERIWNWQVKQEQAVNMKEVEAKLRHVQEEWNLFKLMVRLIGESDLANKSSSQTV
jgi:singapore isolate B (sub-type 7) whole genome shotgun sequence assembly, scaffold_7